MTPSGQSLRDDFLTQLADPAALLQLLDYLPEVYFFAKDARGRFVLMNEANLRLHGCQHLDQVLGKTDFDFHPRHLAEQYIREDRQVIESRHALPHQTWLVSDATGQLRWFISSKTPLFAGTGAVLGIAGVMRDLQRTDSLVRPYQELEQVLTFVLDHYSEGVRVEELARLVHLSVSQFDRKFKRLFRMTPQQYIQRVRLNAARQALVRTSRSISAIAAETGFYDQSSFTKQFARYFGHTPRAFRSAFAEDSLRSAAGPALRAETPMPRPPE